MQATFALGGTNASPEVVGKDLVYGEYGPQRRETGRSGLKGK